MLVRFAVENFLSFKEENVFEMLPSRDQSHSSHILKEIRPDISVLRAAAIYGANGSGKSNFVLAIDFARALIINGTKGEQPIDLKPFRLNKLFRSKPSKFEFTFVHEDVLYNYGFKASSNRIEEEWLFGTPNRKEVLYFERVTSRQGKVKVAFGPTFAGKKKDSTVRKFSEFIALGTRPNQLFLTEASERNVQIAKSVLAWFERVLQIVTAESRYSGLEVVAHENKSFTEYLGNILNSVGTGIEKVTTTTLPLNLDETFTEMPEAMKTEIKTKISQGQSVLVSSSEETFAVTAGKDKQPIVLKLQTHHTNSDGGIEAFEIEDESDGTIRLMHLVPILFNSKFKELVFIIDELDRRLHTNLSQAFVRAYLDCEDKLKSRGQLIFTTHDTNLLDANLMRNDEVWFVEKDKQGSSHMYSLANFSIRKGLKIEKGYLNGRFGAIPFIGNLENLDIHKNSYVEEKVDVSY